MKLFTTLRALLATCLIASATAATAAPTLIVTNGILMGAKNVNVGGIFYNVAFKDGTCATVFGGCLAANFDFKTSASAVVAAQALLDQVFVDGPAGNFDTTPSKIFGCGIISGCDAFVPFFAQFNSTNDSFIASARAQNRVNAVNDQVSASFSTNVTDNFSSNLQNVFADFELTGETSVPEPSSIALLSLALAGLTALRRRKS